MVPLVRNSLGTVVEFETFFHLSAQRSQGLKKIMQTIPDSRCTQLVVLCDTRWIERHEFIARFSEMYVPVVHVLAELAN
jgi:hypothetical protein